MITTQPIFLSLFAICVTLGCDQTPPDETKLNFTRQARGVSGTSPDRQLKVTPPQRKILRERPDAYLDWNWKLKNANAGDWREAIEPLKEHGDRYTLAILAEIQQKKPPGVSLQTLQKLATHIQKTHPKNSIKPWEVQLLLERAAYADLQCHVLEYSLRNWTLETLREFRDIPEIRAELEFLRDNYQTQIETENLFDEEYPAIGITKADIEKMFLDSMNHRVVRYTKEILRDERP